MSENRETNNNKVKDGALRWSDGKLELQRVPTSISNHIARVLQKASKKYPDNEDGTANWMKGLDLNGLVGNLERHIEDFKNGDDYDKDTGEHVLAHVACNIAFILHYLDNGIYDKLDNRMFRKIND